MADLRVQVSSGEIAAGASAKTFIALTAPSNQRLKIKSVEVFGKGTSNTDPPAKIELVTFASKSGGTDAATNVTSKLDGDFGETVQTTVNGPYTAEPTYTTAVVVRTWECHPQVGLVYQFLDGDEIKIKGGTGLALRITQAGSDTFAAVITFEE